MVVKLIDVRPAEFSTSTSSGTTYTYIHTDTYSHAFRLLRALAPCAALRSELVGLNLAWEGNALGRYAEAVTLGARSCNPIDVCTKATPPIRVHQTATRNFKFDRYRPRLRADEIHPLEFRKWKHSFSNSSLWWGLKIRRRFNTDEDFLRDSARTSTYILAVSILALPVQNGLKLSLNGESEGAARYEKGRLDEARDKFSILPACPRGQRY